jgi:O-antigen/teichoic acid export membrane protein
MEETFAAVADTPTSGISAAAPREADPTRRGAGKVKPGKKFYGRTAKVGALWSLMRQGGNEILGVPASMIMARLLSPHDFGVAAASSLFMQLATRLTQFGFGAALIRIKNMRPEHATSVYAVNQVMGAITFVTLYLASPYIGMFFHSPEAGRLLSLAALTFVISPLGTVPAALLQRRMQFRYTVLADWTDTIVGLVVTITFALNGYAFWSIVYGHLSGLVVRVLLQMYLAQWVPTLYVSRASLKELLSFGLGLHSKRLLDYAASNVDNLVVGRVLGMSALGIYDKAFTTMNKIVFRLTLGQAPFRIFSIIHEDEERFRRAYARLMLSITLLAYPLLAGCIVLAKPLFLVLYGQKWLSAAFPFQLLCVGGMLKLQNAYAAQVNEAVGNIWPQVRRQAIGAVLVFVGAAIGSIYGGVTGVALGVLIAIALLTVAMQDLVRKATGLSWMAMLKPQLPSIACAASVVVVLLAAEFAFRRIVPAAHAWQMLLAEGIVGALFYAAFVIAGPFIAVHNLVTETLDDLLPKGPAQIVNRFRRAPSGGGA